MMKKDSKIYVAGHTGLVGSSLVRGLKRHGFTNLMTRDFPGWTLETRWKRINSLPKKNLNMFFLQQPVLEE